MCVRSQNFGVLKDGIPINQYILSNKNGVEVRIIDYGASVTSIVVPDIKGNYENVILGFEDLQSYLNCDSFIGSTIGRYCNRIESGSFTIENVVHNLSRNEGQNHLHGGAQGFDKAIWRGELQDTNSVKFKYQSCDGEMGYPGNLEVSVQFTLNQENELIIEYLANTDKTTPINLTNHCYFNLTGDPSTSILNHELIIKANYYTPVNDQLIPTGEIRPVADSLFDFTSAQTIGASINELRDGYDHNFVLNNGTNDLSLAATLFDPQTCRKLEVFTTEPALQLYTGNNLDGSIIGSNGVAFQKHSALCLETQHFPNSLNEPKFPSTLLKPHQTFRSVTKYKFTVSG